MGTNDRTMCGDISEFLDVLKQMRVVDDQIVQGLNTSIPTESFSSKVDANATCKDLFLKLVDSHANRDNALQQCLNLASENIQILRVQKNAAPNDIQILKKLKREQTKLRELQTQTNVEEVIRGRTRKIYNERCRSYYKPPTENDSQL